MGLQPVASQSVAISYSGPSDFTAKHAAVIGDQSAAGNITHTRYDNTAIDVDYPTSFEMLAKGQEGEQVTVSLGDAFDVNAPIVAGYYMNTAYGVSLADETGLSTLYFENMAAVADTRLGAGSSFHFTNNTNTNTNTNSNSKLWGDGISQLNKATELGFSIEVKRNAAVTADIVDLGQGALRLRQVGSELEASIRTTAGTAVVSLPMPLDEWMQAAVHYTQGELVLHLNAQRIASPITGALDFNWANQTGSSRQNGSLNHDLVVGSNFNGRLNSLKWYHLDAASVLTFAGGATSHTATITADGTAPVVIQSTGTMQVTGSALAVQRVAVQSPLIKEYASLVSTAAFGQMAGLYMDAVAPIGDVPPDNLAGLLSPPHGAVGAGANGSECQPLP